MRKIVGGLVAAAGFVAAYALPADLVVVSEKEVRPDEAAGFYYLGTCDAGYLYSGSASALGAVSPYRVLADDARGKHFFLVSLPENAALRAPDMAAFGDVRPVGGGYLLATAMPGDVGVLRAMEPGLALRELGPTARVTWKATAEAPPAKKNAAVEAAIKAITAEEYAGYIGKLQSYGTRFSFMAGAEGARNWLRNWYAAQNLEAGWHAFECGRYAVGQYPEAGGNIYLGDSHCLIRRSRDGGATWDTLRPAKATAGSYDNPPASWWFDDDNGIFAGIDGCVALTADGGGSWEYGRYAPALTEGFRSVEGIAFVTRRVGWISYIDRKLVRGIYTPTLYIMETGDGGRTWRRVEWSIESFNHLAFFDETRMWAARYKYGTATRVYYSSDGGETWTGCSTVLRYDEYVCDVAAVGPREVWGVTTAGRVLHTTDGLNWQDVNTGYAGTFLRVEFPTPKCGYIAADPLIKTEDGGQTWSRLEGAPALECHNMAFADARHGLVTDYYGDAVYLTEDGGASWKDISAGLNLREYNVVAERRGTERPDEIVIIGGHYDSTSEDRPWDCPGADDNASGAACAMAAARAFRNVNFKRTVRFMAFGDEEQTFGSGAYARECAERGERIVAVLDADMVCYDEENGGRDDFSVASGDYHWLYEYLVGVGRLYGNGLIYDDYEWEGSDHIAFWAAGYGAIGVVEGAAGEGGIIVYPWYHTTEDTLDKLHPELGVRFVRDFAAMLAHLAGMAGAFPDPPGPGSAAVPQGRPFAVYPNPYCYATCAADVSFVGLKAPATVEIYDLAGRRVSREEVVAGCDECVWRPGRAGGESLAPGVYLYRVEGLEQEETGKIVIAK